MPKIGKKRVFLTLSGGIKRKNDQNATLVPGTHFQVPVECEVEVFQTNVANFPIKTRILTGSTQNRAPKPILGPQAHPGPKGYKNAIFWVSFFNWQQMLFLATNDCNTFLKC